VTGRALEAGRGTVHGAAADGDVAVMHWPAEAARRDDLVGRGLPRLLVVAEGEAPPVAADDLEDWVRGGDPVELYVRKERLRRRKAARVPAVLDADGLLHRGTRWVALSRRELQVATLLLDRSGSLVARADLLAAVCPGATSDDRRLVGSLMRRLQRRIAPLGMRVHTVRASGFLLEIGELPP
jgi:hypothetical protein